MEIIKKIAFYQGTGSDVPNQALAKELAATADKAGIKEIVYNLNNDNPSIQGDCIKVLYEIGYIQPELIADYVDDFLKLLTSKNNRLIWGGMIALSTVAVLKADKIFNNLSLMEETMEKGSVITIDAGVKALAAAASKNDNYRKEILPFLFNHLKTCRAKDVPQHCESTLIAVDSLNAKEFIDLLKARLPEMTPTQAKRIQKVILKVPML